MKSIITSNYTLDLNFIKTFAIVESWKNRTKEQIIKADWEDLNQEERLLPCVLKENPDISLREAGELLDMIP